MCHPPDPSHAGCADAKHMAQANSEYFDTESAAQAFDADWVQVIAKQTTDTLKGRLEWLGIDPTIAVTDGRPAGTMTAAGKLLDYACGMGLVSKTLYPWFGQTRGIDVSASMVQRYNQAATDLGLDPARMQAVQADLTQPSSVIDSPEWHDFDLIVTCMALHHISDPLAALKEMAGRLKPGGRTVIIDWLPDNQPTAPEDPEALVPETSSEFPVAYNGFTQPQMAALFRKAGFSHIDYFVHPDPSPFPIRPENPWARIFFAKGEKV